MWRLLNLAAAACCAAAAAAEPPAETPGSAVAVVYNFRHPASRSVAEHYARARGVPLEQLIGLGLPNQEAITRTVFEMELVEPLLKELNRRNLLEPAITPAPEGGQPSHRMEGRIRYLVLCHGVPLKIEPDPNRRDPRAEGLKPEFQRNEASVESELALLPRWGERWMIQGPLPNPFFGTTNAASMHPSRGMLLVARLDGPNEQISKRLVDLALQAEKEGVWGRAYFDTRGLKEGGYELGDHWIRRAAQATREMGFEVEVDERGETFPASHPMSQVAFYAGWYDEHVSGPFLSPQFEFMPGAFAYHLHSFNAVTLRSGEKHWAGPLLSRGATVLMGSVYEPYLGGTPNLEVFFPRLLFSGFTFGEAAYACQEVLSWQTAVIGDPLFRPFAEPPRQRHARLEAMKSPKLAWSHLAVVNLNLLKNAPRPELIDYLQSPEVSNGEAILLEKLAELWKASGSPQRALEASLKALEGRPSPLQTVRLYLQIAELQRELKTPSRAAEFAEDLRRRFGTHPGLDTWLRALQVESAP